MDRESLEKRPAIVIVGSPNVGKRTLVSRLLNVDFEDSSDSSLELIVNGWTINTKYYKADVSVWTVHLSDEFSIERLPIIDRIVALVMVFDVNNISSLVSLKKWVSRTDITKFEILLCIGNKVDLIPSHPAHTEYKRRLMKHVDNPNLDLSGYGISETEGSSLLGDEEPLSGIKSSCFEWCLENNIEYVEACASNANFDKCLSVDGDSQGVERLYGALTAHMWPGMLLKSGDKIDEPSLPEQEDSSEEESDYEPEYEILSSGSAEPLADLGWISFDGPDSTDSTTETGLPSERDDIYALDREIEVKLAGVDFKPSTSDSQLHDEVNHEKELDGNEVDVRSDSDESKSYGFEDLEQLMGEIGNIRDGLRLMPDFQRREMAAKLAMKMATMFGDGSGGEEGFE